MRISSPQCPFIGTTTPSFSLTRISGSTVTGSVKLHQNMVGGDISAGIRIDSHRSAVHGNLSAEGQIQLVDSAVYGCVNTRGMLEIISSLVEGNASTDGNIEIQRSVIGSVYAGSIKDDRIASSEICSLTTTNARLILSASNVQDIELRLSRASSAAINAGNVVVSSNWRGFFRHLFSGLRSFNTGTHIQVGVGGSSVVNGFTVKAMTSQTTVVTPDTTVYVNGRKQSGPGPDTYAEYKSQYQGAPNISGHGWTDGKAVIKNFAKPQGPAQVLILEARSVVSGRVVFAGGNGKIVVRQGSEFTGTVDGGVVEKE